MRSTWGKPDDNFVIGEMCFDGAVKAKLTMLTGQTLPPCSAYVQDGQGRGDLAAKM